MNQHSTKSPFSACVSINHHRITPKGEWYKEIIPEWSRSMHMHTHKNIKSTHPLCCTSTPATAVMSGKRGWTSWEQQSTEILWPQISGILIWPLPSSHNEQLCWLLFFGQGRRRKGESKTNTHSTAKVSLLAVSQLLQLVQVFDVRDSCPILNACPQIVSMWTGKWIGTKQA